MSGKMIGKRDEVGGGGAVSTLKIGGDNCIR